MREKKSGIYRIRNLVNGKVYVGQSIDIIKRWSDHKSCLRKQKHHTKHLQASWNKYGEENFIFEILEVIKNPTKELLYEREQYWYDLFESNNPKKGYNKCIIVESNLGIKFGPHTEEHKKKISISLKGVKHPMYGKHHTLESKKNMSEAHKGKELTEEHKLKISIANSGEKNYMFGKHLSPETIKKISKTLTGKMVGIKNPFYGKTHTDEAKKKLSIANLGKFIGDKNPNAKLTWNEVREIREKYKPFEYSLNKLAKEYNVSKKTILGIIQNKIWKEENIIEDKSK